MTARNRHSRRNDHTGTMSIDHVDVDEITDSVTIQYPARTPLSTVLTGLATRLPARHAFVARAVIQRTMNLTPFNTTFFTADAVIGTPSPIQWPGFLMVDAVIAARRVTADAVIKKTISRTFTADAKIV